MIKLVDVRKGLMDGYHDPTLQPYMQNFTNYCVHRRNDGKQSKIQAPWQLSLSIGKWPFFSIYDHRRYFSNKFKVLIASFKSSTKTNVLFYKSWWHDGLHSLVWKVKLTMDKLINSWLQYGVCHTRGDVILLTSTLKYSLWSGACQHQTKCPELICLCSLLQQLHCVLWVGEMNMYKPSVGFARICLLTPCVYLFECITSCYFR